MENFYYEVLYNLIRAQTDHATKATTLKHMKAKITRLHHEEQKRLFLNNADRDRIDDESPSLYHSIRARKRQETRTVQTIQDRIGVIHTTMPDIKHTFKDYMQTKFDIISVDGESLRRLMEIVTKSSLKMRRTP
jgi:arginine deiminase